MVHHKVGVLLANIGSPGHPDKQSVKKYLTEFLMDERVIDLPHWKRQLLVKGIIAPFRSGRSAEAYRKIWLPEGSPLIVYSKVFAQQLQKKLPEHYLCRFAARYGKPSFQEVLESFRSEGVQELLFVPLFPQFAAATTESAVVHLKDTLQAMGNNYNPPIKILAPFYHEPSFIESLRKNYEKYRGGFAAEQVIFSFHGLPKRQILKADPTKNYCLQSENCCAHPSPEVLTQCYRAQCFATAKTLAQAMNLSPEDYQISFQSRLGSDPWTPPYTVDVLDQLIAKGVKRVLFICPAFVTDCLETLEEIAVGLAEGWKRAGGEELKLIPSLNYEDYWVEGFADLIGKLEKFPDHHTNN